jgi:hypothetical protein
VEKIGKFFIRDKKYREISEKVFESIAFSLNVCYNLYNVYSRKRRLFYGDE